MPRTVEMPKLGNTVEECLLTTWVKHTGDTVCVGDVLAEVETDKASFEVTSPADGVVLDTFCDEGEAVPVYTAICAIGTAGEKVTRPGSAPVAAERSPVPAAPPGPEPVAAPSVERRAQAPPVVPAPPPQPESSGGLESPGGPERPAGLDGPIAGPRLSPRARRFARAHGVSPAVSIGTGPGGRVTEADVRDAYRSAARLSGAAAAAVAAGELPPQAGSGIGGLIRLCDLDPPPAQLSPVRQRIATRVRQSLGSTAQYTLNRSANAAGLLAVRAAMKSCPATAGITIGDVVAFCAIRALLHAPELNAELTDGELHLHSAVHLAFAVDTDRGLLAPVVRDSQRLTLVELSARMRDLAEQAMRGNISPDDLTGGTFTISNLGSLGVDSFTPVLNPPQVAILGVDAITVRAARKADGNIEFIDAIGLSLTLDHQVIDGAPGARFLSSVAHAIEDAEALCMT